MALQTSSNRSTNINFYEISSDGNVPSIVHSFEDIGPKFIFSLKVGKPVVRMANPGESEKKKKNESGNKRKKEKEIEIHPWFSNLGVH